jgi:hypothetical protein
MQPKKAIYLPHMDVIIYNIYHSSIKLYEWNVITLINQSPTANIVTTTNHIFKTKYNVTTYN